MAMRAIRPMVVALKWLATLGAVAAVLVAAWYVNRDARGQRAEETAPTPPPFKFIQGVLKLNAQSVETFGIKDETAKDIDWVPKVAIYGRVVPNPRATTEARAAFAGKLRAPAGGKWPNLAAHVKAGEVLAYLEVRLGPQDRLDLQAKLGEAKIRQDGAAKVVQIHKERVKRLETAPQTLVRSDLDAALVALADAETQLATSSASVKLYQDALAALDQPGDPKQTAWSVPVNAPADGEITELAAQPDTVVEAGGLVARVVDFRKALVRVDIPANLLTGPPPTSLKLFVLPAPGPAFEGPNNRTEPAEPPKAVTATRVGVAPQVDPALQAAGYLFEVTGSDDSAAAQWRPGLFVKAYLPVNDAKPIPAVAVPKGALLYHQGRALVYVRLSGNRFKRAEVTVLGRDGDWWVLSAGVDADDQVVTAGALALLSAEFRADVDND
jgi:hypothetical protein